MTGSCLSAKHIRSPAGRAAADGWGLRPLCVRLRNEGVEPRDDVAFNVVPGEAHAHQGVDDDLDDALPRCRHLALHKLTDTCGHDTNHEHEGGID